MVKKYSASEVFIKLAREHVEGLKKKYPTARVSERVIRARAERTEMRKRQIEQAIASGTPVPAGYFVGVDLKPEDFGLSYPTYLGKGEFKRFGTEPQHRRQDSQPQKARQKKYRDLRRIL